MCIRDSHLFNLNTTPGKNKQNEICVLTDSFEHALERLIGIPNDTDLINAAFVNKIVTSTYHVSINSCNIHSGVANIAKKILPPIPESCLNINGLIHCHFPIRY